MDPVAQLHTAQQRLFEALDLGTWDDVTVGVGHLIELEQRGMHPAARRCGLGAVELDPGLTRHALWVGLLRCDDHPAWRERLRSTLIDHVAWMGAEVLPAVCARLDRDAYEELGALMSTIEQRPTVDGAA